MRNTTQIHRQFVENCEDILAQQEHVRINDAALEGFAKTLKASSFIPDWKDYISKTANSADNYDFKRAFYELAIITAQNGGYIFENENGAADKWQKDGSGAKAMVEKMAAIRSAGAVPFYDVAEADVPRVLAPLVQGMPFADKRLAMFGECADKKKHKAVMALLDRAFDGQKYVFDLQFARELGDIFPESFGDDPFMKKNILVGLMAASNAHHHGVTVDTSDMIVASDYVLPQVLNADDIGILSFSEELTQKLQSKTPLPEDSDEVTALRAAAVVACDRLSEASGLEAREIDGFLWMAGRKVKGARPHMMCYTTRF